MVDVMKNGLVIVDEQVDFAEGGALPVAGGTHVAKRTYDYVMAHGDDYLVIVATKDWHPDPGYTTARRLPSGLSGDYHFEHFSENPDYDTTWPPHCVQNTPGSEFIPALHAEEGFIDRVFFKGQEGPAYSGFEGVMDLEEDRLAILDEGWSVEGVQVASLDWYLKYWGITDLDIVGLALDYCVKATALDAAKLGYHTRLLMNLTAAVNGAAAQHPLLEMGQHGIEITVGQT